MMNEFFLGWEYSERFHLVTGTGFYLFTLIAIIYGCYIILRALKGITYVDAVTNWYACECKESVKKHLVWVVSTVIVMSLTILMVAGYDLKYNWMEVPHEAHFVHYMIVAVYLMVVRWARASVKHFTAMATCNGNLYFHQTRLLNES